MKNNEIEKVTLAMRSVTRLIKSGRKVQLSNEFWDLCIAFDQLQRAMQAHGVKLENKNTGEEGWKTDD